MRPFASYLLDERAAGATREIGKSAGGSPRPANAILLDEPAAKAVEDGGPFGRDRVLAKTVEGKKATATITSLLGRVRIALRGHR